MFALRTRKNKTGGKLEKTKPSADASESSFDGQNRVVGKYKTAGQNKKKKIDKKTAGLSDFEIYHTR